MTKLIEGGFYVVDERLNGKRGYTVRDHRATIIYHLRLKSEAFAACNRLNEIDNPRKKTA